MNRIRASINQIITITVCIIYIVLEYNNNNDNNKKRNKIITVIIVVYFERRDVRGAEDGQRSGD